MVGAEARVAGAEAATIVQCQRLGEPRLWLVLRQRLEEPLMGLRLRRRLPRLWVQLGLVLWQVLPAVGRVLTELGGLLNPSPGGQQ